MQLGVVLTALAVLVGAVASAASTTIPWVQLAYAAAAALSIAAVIVQYRASQPYIYAFTDADWQANGQGDKVIVVTKRRHRKGKNATGRLEARGANGDWETVMGDATTRANGDVVTSIGAANSLAGRIVVY